MKKNGSHYCRAAQNGLEFLHQVHKADKVYITTAQQERKWRRELPGWLDQLQKEKLLLEAE